MLPYCTAEFANPSGVHAAARRARRALDDARDEMASVLGCAPGEVVFTSGGTEADNLAVLGVHGRVGGLVVTSAIEHDVSVMVVNNEVGTVQPLGDVVASVRRAAPRALVHSDAVQAVVWRDVAVELAECDLVSVSAHKFGGPKGVGALVVRRRAVGALGAICAGGGQERGLRPGTENVAGIVAMAAAARATVDERAGACARTRRLRDRFLDGLTEAVPGMVESAPRDLTAPGHAHVRFPGVAAEELLFLIDEAGVAASAGSACSSGAIEPSHVLRAMGWRGPAVREAVRFTLGPATTEAEIDFAADVVAAAAASLTGLDAMGD